MILSMAVLAAVVFAAGVTVAALTPRSRPVAALGVLLALALIGLLTLTPTDSTTASVNLEPGDGLDWGSPARAVNILGNLLLFVPLGVTLAATARVLRSPLLVVPLAAAVSGLVELTQYAYVPGRAADIDDIILNTTGALVGLIALRSYRMVSDRVLAQA
jgi:hypothetical protein